MIARWVCFFQLPTVLPTLPCIRLLEWRAIPWPHSHFASQSRSPVYTACVSAGLYKISSLLLSLLSPGRQGIRRLNHNVLLQQGRGRSLAPLCALLTPRDGKMPTSPAFPHLILPCWCQMQVEAQLSASLTGPSDREAECWLLCLSAPYSTSLMQGGLEALYWDPLTGCEWGAALGVLVFTASFGLFAASWVWRFSSPLELTDTRNRRKMEYLLLPTYFVRTHWCRVWWRLNSPLA